MPPVKQRPFQKELRSMMYGFGDVQNPRQDTVRVLEDLLMDYLADTMQEAAALSLTRSGYASNAKIKTEDIIHVARKDPKKYARIEELLFMNEELKKARKAFEIDELQNLQPAFNDDEEV